MIDKIALNLPHYGSMGRTVYLSTWIAFSKTQRNPWTPSEGFLVVRPEFGSMFVRGFLLNRNTKNGGLFHILLMKEFLDQLIW